MNPSSPIQHLSEEELDDVLLGLGTDAAQLHLAACELCSAQLAPFQTSVSAFNQGSMAWAQAKSNTISRDLSTANLSTSRRQPMAWAGGVAMIAAVGFAIGMGLHPGQQKLEPVQAPVAQTSAADNAQEIAADNAMLNAINSEISTAAPAPLQPFRAVNARRPRNPASEVNN